MALRALVFDVDGTLAETEEVHRAAFNAAFAAHGFDWHWDRKLYGELLKVTGGKERLRHYLLERRAAPPPADLDALIVRLHEDKNRRYAALLDGGGMRLRPGVARLIGEARAAGLKLAIATTTSPESVDRLIDVTLGREARGWFASIVAADRAPRKKPAPDVYELACRELGLPPGACLALEDSAAGVRAARAAGVPVVVTVSSYTEGQDFTGALAVLDRLGEPDAPFAVLAGEARRRAYADLALLREWHGAGR